MDHVKSSVAKVVSCTSVGRIFHSIKTAPGALAGLLLGYHRSSGCGQCRRVFWPSVTSNSGMEDPRGTWFPSLEKWLLSSWVDAATVTDKAVKSDGADIHTAL
jgi:hypothetical protein